MYINILQEAVNIDSKKNVINKTAREYAIIDIKYVVVAESKKDKNEIMIDLVYDKELYL
tara:strand:+ start:2105 stop:2281 length:177 start_codon:yes stop_codon:yes gene_type:complete